ncbi:MAG: PTS sugar transporter subunit IIC [Gemmatimonadaceae bacterium]
MSFEIVPAVILGALLGVDVVSFTQTMVSRPIVAATLAGIVAGDTMAGLLAGASLELVALETLPVGASKYPEWGSASVVGGTFFASSGADHAGALVLAVLAAIVTAWGGGWSMYFLRRINGALARRMEPDLRSGRRGAGATLQALGIVGDFIRGGLVTLIALLLLGPLAGRGVQEWSLDAHFSVSAVAAVTLAVAVSATWKLVSNTAGARVIMVGGVALGLTLLIFG